ncbi:MAG: DNA/RNA nuclease SfsA [Candidatus Delongbacteria bacterium]|nr:DNA/RNA nuclease SfsA [Candidatus Delongbacteria bacterium]MBN2834727.1 DNA/RNA nuclease SfsA [Candidatus Delongbacteria bacterium]
MIKARFIRRYKRFFVEALNNEGIILTAHCPNTGSMQQCSDPNSEVLLSSSSNLKRKLKYTLEFVKIKDNWVMVNTIKTNRIIEIVLKNGLLDVNFDHKKIYREVKFGIENSRVDFLLENHINEKFYLEVKNVTLTDNMTTALFPDAETKRGQKHIYELLHELKIGNRVGIIFAIQRPECDSFDTNKEIDPKYHSLLKDAVKQGLEIFCAKIIYDNDLEPVDVKLIPFLNSD